MRTRTRLALSAALALTLGLTACAPQGGTPGGTNSDDTSLVVGLVLEPTDLDIRHTGGIALDQVLIDNVYEGLVARTADGQIVDNLAASHEISEDGLNYTFVLNDGITFHDGTAVDANLVAASFEQIRADEAFTRSEDLAAVTAITATDEKTLSITLSQPDSTLLWNLAGRAGLVLNPSADNELSTSANGTGPFRLDRWKKGDSITLSRNDDYWGTKAALSEVVFRYIPDFSAAINAVRAGDVDVQTSLDATLAEQITPSSGYEVVSGRTTDKYTLAMNNTRAPFDDVRVREAVRLAIDHPALIEALGGSAVPQGGPIPELDPGYEDLTGIAPHDPDRARALLAEAGAENLAVTLTMPSFYSDTVGTVLTSQLKDVGIALTVNRIEFATWLNDVYTNKNYELSMVNHAESHDFGNWANPEYYFGFQNDEVSALYAESLSATSPEQAADALARAARIVSENHAADWLYNTLTLTAVREGVTGFPTDSTTARLDLGAVSVTR